jgi:leucyl-tRNA---protein transferase
LSMIYSFYDPEHEARTGLGNYIILDHIRRAGEAGLPYVYLGYWVEGSQRMQYKIRYRPLERLGPAGWRRFSDAEQGALIAASASPREAAPCVEGGSKDGTPGGQKQYKLA